MNALRPWRREAIVVAATLAVLVPANLAFDRVPGWSVAIGIGAAGAFLAVAHWLGLQLDDLGLARSTLGRGAAYAGAGAALVAVGCVVLAAIPATRAAFLDTRYDQGIGAALLSALVVIPLGTVLAEELAFRGLIWGGLNELLGGRWATIGSAMLFGLWHVPGAVSAAGSNTAVDGIVPRSLLILLSVVGTFVATAVAGLVAGELRRRSGSLLAPAGIHWALNGLGVITSSIVWAAQG